MKRLKRMLAFAVALVMTVGMLPTSAFAAEPGTEQGHVHTAECYESTLVCEKDEHEHGEACYTVTDSSDSEENESTGSEETTEPEPTPDAGSDDSGEQGGDIEADASGDEGGSDETGSSDSESSSDTSSESTEPSGSESSESGTEIEDQPAPMAAEPIKELTCTLEEHTHSEDCYEKTLVCGFEDEEAKAPETNGTVTPEEPSEAVLAFLEAVEALPETVDEENAGEIEPQLQQVLDLFGQLTEEEQQRDDVMAAQLKALSLWEALEGVKADTMAEDNVVEVSTYDELLSAVEAAGQTPTVIHLTESFALKGYLQIKASQNITLTADEGVVLSRNDSAKGNLWVNGELSLEGIVLDGGNVPSGYALVHIESTGKVTMDENTVVQNAYNDYSAQQYGGGIYNAGVLEVNGSTISGNTAKSYGGGVYNKGTFTMNGGVISENENTAWYGGGIYNAGTFTAHGGEIINNRATGPSWAYGGGVYSTVGINMSGTKISGNENGGLEIGGVYLDTSEGTFRLENLTITGNTGKRPALSVFSLANWNITGCQISENKNTNGSVVLLKATGLTVAQDEIAKNSIRILDDCVIRNNTSTTSEGALCLNSNQGITKVTNCRIIENSGKTGGVYCAGSDQTTLGAGTRIEGNIGITTGGVHNQLSSNGKGCVTIDGAVVTGNSGGTTGGVYTAGSRFAFVSGAIYGNAKTGAGKDGGNDFYVMQNKAVYSLIKASEMSDAEMGEGFFAAQEYSWMGAPAGRENEALENAGEISLTAMPNVKRVFARIGETAYDSLAEAVAAAQQGDVVDVVLGEDGFSKKLELNEPIAIDKSMTIQLHDQEILTNGKELFQVGEGIDLNLQGTAMIDGKITVKGNLSMDGSIQPYVFNDGMIIRKELVVDVQSGSFIVNGMATTDSKLNPLHVKLAKGQCITAGEGFNIQRSIKIELDDETYTTFNNANGEKELEDYVLVSGCADPSILSRIEFAQSFSSSFVLVKAIDGNLVLRKTVLEGGVYLDGQNGSDENDGLTSDQPVKTFEKAMEIANEKGMDLIYVVGQVKASGEMDGRLENGNAVTLMRYLAYKGHLISASDLTLTNLILDGATELGVKDGKSLLYATAGTVTLGQGTLLQNNDVSQQSGYPWHYGGGVYVGGGAELVMEDDARIENCIARVGGAVLANGTFTMNGGQIRNNQAVTSKSDSRSGYGGGVAVLTDQGHMTMNGGLIDGNQAAASGGGISLPFTDGNDLEVFSGTISNNTAQSSGGGIFIQCTNKAVVGREQFSRDKVVISGNEAFGKSVNGNNDSQYAGGGIYVNGSKGGYENGVLQLYRVVITNNTAKQFGNGLGACPTGQLEIYLSNGGALYRNQGEVHDDLFMIGMTGLDQNQSDTYYFLSPTMLGGGASNWKYAEYNGFNSPLGSDQGGDLNRLEGYGAHVQLYSDCTDSSIAKAEAAANVRIVDNISHSNGGGIGTNGKVVIGTVNEFEEAEITIDKFWDDEGFEGNRPEYVDVLLYRIVNDDLESEEQFGIIRLYPGKEEDDKWTATYKHLPVNDGLGNIYKYRVEEVIYGGWRDGHGQWHQYEYSYLPTISLGEEYTYIPPKRPDPPVDNGALAAEVDSNGNLVIRKEVANDEVANYRFHVEAIGDELVAKVAGNPVKYDYNGTQGEAVFDAEGKMTISIDMTGARMLARARTFARSQQTIVVTLLDLPEGSYRVTEGEAGDNTGDDTIVVEIKPGDNTGDAETDNGAWEAVVSEGNLVITKEVANDKATLYRFHVEAIGDELVAKVAGTSVKYDYNGLQGEATFDDQGKAAISINMAGASMLARARKTIVVTLLDLPDGSYRVTEGEAIDNDTGSDDSFVVEIKNKIAGNLTIHKTVTGLPGGDREERTFSFLVRAVGAELVAKMAGRSCELVDEEGKLFAKAEFDAEGKATVTITVTGAHPTGSVTLKQLEAGQYVVEEQDASVDGYSWTKTGDGQVEVKAGETVKAAVTNTYTANRLVIKKVLAENAPEAAKTKKYTFEIAGPESINGTYDGVEFKDGKATVTVTGAGEKTISGLPTGKYTVTEQDAKLDGYTWTKTGEGEVEVKVGETVEVSVHNTYTPNTPPPPGNPDEPDEPDTPDTPDEPEIPEPEVPLTPGPGPEPEEPTPVVPETPEEVIELEDPEVPLAPGPEEPEEEIPEEDVPLADVPKTGDESNTQLWLALALMSLCGMAFVGRKSDENAQ